jgi:hypothetical protein
MVSGTYSLVSGLLRMVRDTDVTVEQLRRLRDAAEAARQRDTPALEDLLADEPSLIPFVNEVARHFPGQPLLLMLLVVLGVLLPYMEAAAHHHATPTHAEIVQIVERFDAPPDRPEPEEATLAQEAPRPPWQAPYLRIVQFGTRIEDAQGDFTPGRYLDVEMENGEHVRGWILNIDLQADGSHKLRLAMTDREAQRLQAGANPGASPLG